jgi:hypothetical protein
MSHRPVAKRDPKTGQVTVPLVPGGADDAASKDYVDTEILTAVPAITTYTPTITNITGFTGIPTAVLTTSVFRVQDIVNVQLAIQSLSTPVGVQNCTFDVSLPVAIAGGNFVSAKTLGEATILRVLTFEADSGILFTVAGTQTVRLAVKNTNNATGNAVWINIHFMYNAVTPA